MRKHCLMHLSALLSASAALSVFVASASGDDSWPQWRGSGQDGVADGDSYPIRWNDEAGIAWSIPIPGSGGSTPVVADGVAYLTSGVGESGGEAEGRNTLFAIDLATGATRWTVDLGADRGGKHRKGSGSNPSPVIDGDRVYAYFRSGDFACVSTDGKVRWQTNLQDRFGEDTLWWDLGSSPMVNDQSVVIAVMQTGPSYLAAFDKASGDLLWKTDRQLGAPEEAAQSYTTPLAVTIDGRDAIAVMGADYLTLHDAADGTILGQLGGFNPEQNRFFRSIASPVADGNVIVCPYARGESLTAVAMDDLVAGKGRDAILWVRDDVGSDVSTPAADAGRVYVVDDSKQGKGTVSCLDLGSGDTLWSVTLPKSRIDFSSSPLVAGDHLYVTQEDATTHVIGPLSAPAPQLISSNVLGDDVPFTVASPVPTDDSLLIRSRHRLYRIVGE